MTSTTSYRKVHAQITDESTSAMRRYQDITLGKHSLTKMIGYELTMLVAGGVPGALGLWLRKTLYPRLLNQVGRGTVFGRHVTLRHPHKIRLGNQVIVDDACVLDARGDENEGITTGNNVMLARNIVLGCKNGNIRLGDHVGIGANSIIHAIGHSGVTIGDNVVIGAYTYLVGGSHYHVDRTDMPIAHQGLDLKGGICIEDNVWFGARVTVMDGITIGHDAIVGAGAVVTKDIPAFAIAVGVPAKVVGSRLDKVNISEEGDG